MHPYLLVGHDLTTTAVLDVTTTPTDAGARRRYRQWVDRRLHRSAIADAARPVTNPTAPSTAGFVRAA